MKSITDNLTASKIRTIILGSLIALSLFLRLYHIKDTIIFLGDEGRDALAVKRILIDHKPTLLGPTASVGGFYLGPVYYYMIAPFMLVFGMDPVGAAVMVALMGVSTVILLFVTLEKWHGLFAASLTSLLYSVSPGILGFSRSSWNPNPMPLFVLLSILSLHIAIHRKKIIFAFFSTFFFGIIIQLHYLGILVASILALTTFLMLPRSKWLKYVLIEIAGFLVGASMFLAFEIRHGFLNTQAVFEFITRNGGATGPKSWNLPWLFVEVNRFNIESVIGSWAVSISRPLALALVISLILYLILQFKHKKPIVASTKTILLYWLLGTAGLSIYRGQWHFHYFELFFPAPFLVLSLLISGITSRLIKSALISTTLIISAILIYHAPTWEEGSKLLDQTERISNKVIELSENKPFNFALITNGNSDHAYRFFLEINNHIPTPLEEKVEEQLIIVCEKYPENTCAPLGNPLWEVAGFGRAEIDAQTEVFPNTTLYRLIHHSDSIDTIGKPALRG